MTPAAMPPAPASGLPFLSRLRLRLLLLVVAALAPAMLLILFMASQHYDKARVQVQEAALRLVRVAATDHARQFSAARRMLFAVADMEVVRYSGTLGCGIGPSNLVSPETGFIDLQLIDAEGNRVCIWPAGADSVSAAESALARQAIEADRFVVGGHGFDARTGRSQVHLAQPITPAFGKMPAAVVLSYDLSGISDLIRGSGLPEHAVIAIMDDQGVLLYRYPEPGKWVGKRVADSQPARTILGREHEGVIETTGFDGVPRLFAFRPLRLEEGGEPLYVYVGIPGEVAYKGVMQALAVALGGLGVVSMIVLALAWVGGNALIGRPIGALVAAVKQLGSGDYGARSSLGHLPGEIGQLATAFDGMAEALQQRQFEVEQLKFAMDEHAIVSIAGLDGRITFVNDKFVGISQYSREELLGQDHRILNSGYHDKAFFVEMWRTLAGGFPWQGVIRNRSKDGNFYWVATTIVPVLGTDGRHYQYISIRTEVTRIKQIEESLRHAHNELERLVEQRTGQLSRAMLDLERDVARRAKVEAELIESNTELIALNQQLSDAQNQLLQSEKMASIGQLAAGVAHEINNPIGYVYSNLGTLQKYLQQMFGVLAAYESAEGALAPEALEALRALKREADLEFLREDVGSLMAESREGITRVKKIVQDLKDFSHVGAQEEWQWADLHKGLDSTLNIVNNEIKYKAQVVKRYGELPEVRCLPSQLNQVFMNLLVNAAHAIEQQGEIRLSSGVSGEEVWVEVADTGKGIAPEHLGRIFDPFFTTKAVGQGTGLGLSLSYGIVRKHHGRIEVESEPGKGATFRVWLPVNHVDTSKPVDIAVA